MEESNSIEKILKNLKENPIDWKEVNERIKRNEEETKKRIEEVRRLEEERFNNVKCPVCKSTNKEQVIKSKGNGIIGPGYHSHVTEEYLVCKECGVMFKDLNKSKK